MEKMVPRGGQTAPFRGVWRVSGGFSLLGRLSCRRPPSPESLLAAFWGCWGTFWPPCCRSRQIFKHKKNDRQNPPYQDIYHPAFLGFRRFMKIYDKKRTWQDSVSRLANDLLMSSLMGFKISCQNSVSRKNAFSEVKFPKQLYFTMAQKTNVKRSIKYEI